jgi:hypothetical protein
MNHGGDGIDDEFIAVQDCALFRTSALPSYGLHLL